MPYPSLLIQTPLLQMLGVELNAIQWNTPLPSNRFARLPG